MHGWPPFLLVLSHASVACCICKAFSATWHAKMEGLWLNRQERRGQTGCSAGFAMRCGMKVGSVTNCVRMSLNDSALSMLLWPSMRRVFGSSGDKSAGVAPQYCGTTKQVENCQVGVFLSYISHLGHTLLDRELYLPRHWVEDRSRCEEAGIP